MKSFFFLKRISKIIFRFLTIVFIKSVQCCVFRFFFFLCFEDTQQGSRVGLLVGWLVGWLIVLKFRKKKT